MAEKSGISLPTIQRMEKLGLERSSVGNAEKVLGAMEKAGVIFLADGEAANGGPGVRLRGDSNAG